MNIPLGLNGAEAGTILGVVLVVGVAVGRVAVKRWRAGRTIVAKLSGALDVLIGRPPFIDHATGQEVPQVLPLGTALTMMRSELKEQGTAISDLTSVVQQVADQQAAIVQLQQGHRTHDERLDGHDLAIGGLIGAKYESGAQAALRAEELRQAAASAAIDEEDAS